MAVDRYHAKATRGYAKLAQKMGREAEFFRPMTAHDPLTPGSSTGSMMVRVDVDGDFRTQRVALPGKPIYFAAFDRTDALTGDFFRFEDGSTYYVLDVPDIVPTPVVRCNRTLTLKRVGQATGRKGYAGRESAAVMTNWPVSMLEGTKGEKGLRNLPDESRRPWFDVLMPYFPGLKVKTNDIVTDDLGNDYEVSSPELTHEGYRLTVGFVGVSE